MKTMRLLICAAFAVMSLLLLPLRGAFAAEGVVSPEWVSELPVAKDANQLFIVAGVGDTTAWDLVSDFVNGFVGTL